MRGAPSRLLFALLVVLAGCSTFAPPTDAPTAPDATASPTPLADDRDGFTDCQERALTDADPDRMDVYVEIDWTAGAKPAPEQLQRLVAVYGDAPVANPSGERGVDLHLVYSDELPASDSPVDHTNVSWYRQRHFDNAGRGYHYALFVEDVAGDTKGKGDAGTIIVQHRNPEQAEGFYVRLFAHELGHSLGLTREVHDGVDNRTVPYETYPSVMSYAGVYEAGTLDFSNGSKGPGDFDDWGYLAGNLTVPDTSRLERSGDC